MKYLEVMIQKPAVQGVKKVLDVLRADRDWVVLSEKAIDEPGRKSFFTVRHFATEVEVCVQVR
jgi:hypothetical protein